MPSYPDESEKEVKGREGPENEALRLVLKDYDDAQEWHQDYSDNCDKWYRSYRGLVEKRTKPRPWTNKIHPPYALDNAETIVANLADEKMRFRAKPRPMVSADLEKLAMLRDAAEAQQNQINAQLDRCRFEEKQRPFYLQNVICGLTALKTYWRKEQRTVRRKVQRSVPHFDEWGMFLGETLEDDIVKEPLSTYDDAYAEVVDVRDFWWSPGGAVHFDRVSSCTHRTWQTMDELRELEKSGIYKNVDGLADTKDYSGLTSDRERDLFNVSRTKGKVEVLERWTRERRIVVANRKVVLLDEDNPYHHGDLPFVVCSTRPDLFRIPGISEIENIATIQEGMWTLMNQRLDNTELLNNVVLIYNRLMMASEDLELAPGAQIEVDGDPKSAFHVWEPTPLSAQISMPAEQALRSDMDRISGAAPLMPGGQTSGIDRETATSVSISTTIAQRVLAAKKQQGYMALTRMIDQFAWLNRQFMNMPRLIETVGEKGAIAYKTVLPQHFEPDVQFDFEPAQESLMRQERRAESQALLQMALSAFQPCLLSGHPLAIHEIVKHHLKQYDIDDPDRFFADPATAQQMLGGMQGGQPGMAQPGQQQPGSAAPNMHNILAQMMGQGGPQQGGNGTTSPLASGPMSPSNVNSLSPAAAPSQMYSQTGRQS